MPPEFEQLQQLEELILEGVVLDAFPREVAALSRLSSLTIREKVYGQVRGWAAGLWLGCGGLQLGCGGAVSWGDACWGVWGCRLAA